MFQRIVVHHRNCIAATLVAAFACAGGNVRGEDAPLTPLTPAAAESSKTEKPAEPSDSYAAAAEHFGQAKWSEAAAAFQAFLVERPDDPRTVQARYFLGESLLRDGKHAAAAAAFRTALQSADDPATQAVAQFRLGEASYLSRKYADAVATLDMFLDAHPAHPAAPRASYYLVESAYSAGQYERAETAAAYFTAVYPDAVGAPRAALLQAASLLQLGRTHEARTVLVPLAAEAADRDPTIDALTASLELAAADEALAAGDLATAETRFRQFLTEHKSHDLASYATYRLAELAAAAGKWSDAAAQFASALKQEKLSADLRPLAWLAQVQALAQDRDWDAVLKVTEAAGQNLRTWSRRYEFDYLRGRAHLAKAEMNEARTAFGRVLSSQDAAGTETAALAQYMLGETHFLQRRYDAALADYRRAAEHAHPHWQAAAHLQAGKCCEQLNRPDEARAAYNAVLRDFAASPFAAEAQTRREACLRQAAAPGTPQRK